MKGRMKAREEVIFFKVKYGFVMKFTIFKFYKEDVTVLKSAIIQISGKL